MHKKLKKRERLGCVWYCRNCKLSISILIDAQIYNIRIEIKMLLKFAFYFFQKIHFKYEYIIRNCNISEDTNNGKLKLFRNKISKYVRSQNNQLGGPLKKV
ncbi:hypothetical protein DMUE_5266 [Dictyocoela muelleri]|nr:hypothetical protein DMUE_5266 [Dictyocoela muelleri]